MQFKLILDGLIHAKRPSSFLEFGFESTYMPGFGPSDKLLYQITVSMSTEKEPISDDVCPWLDEISDKLLHKFAI